MSEQSKSEKSPAPTSASDSNRMWGGRFAGGPAEIMEQINASIDFDRRLAAQDIAGSKAHCEMLVRQKIISREDGDLILEGLERIRIEIEHGDFNFSRALEDIHMNIEARLKEIVGETAGRLHTARSRNDQVATDFRLFVRETIDRLDGGLQELQSALIDQAEAHADAVMPGYTHLQPAQPVTFGHHMLAYVEMVGRDRGRIAGALGFERPTANSIDSVSDRDFALEFLAAGAIAATHLSRLAEEIVLWCAPGFGFIELSDAFTTGSSIMPQKKNPDAAELVRAKAGRVIGALNTLLIVMKGLPLAFCKDMQEDKEALFDAADTLVLSVAASSGMVRDMTPVRAALKAATSQGFITATDLADWLVRVLDMPFREAHHVTGRIVRLAEQKDCELAALELSEMQSIEPRITAAISEVLEVESAVESRGSYGGTAPQRVRQAAAAARERFL
jgi:argininosuccinate lyase